MNKYKKVEVEWLDAQSSFGLAQPIEELIDMELTTTYSTGYLLHEDDEKIILGFMLFGENMVKHDQTIPKGIIRKITTLVNSDSLIEKLYKDPEPCCHGVRKEDAIKIINEINHETNKINKK